MTVPVEAERSPRIDRAEQRVGDPINIVGTKAEQASRGEADADRAAVLVFADRRDRPKMIFGGDAVDLAIGEAERC